jgi:hypothetical protein
MSELARIAALFGGIVAALGLMAVAAPAPLTAALKAFPRGRWPAWGLVAVDMAWVGWLLHVTYLGPLEFLKPYLAVEVPVAFVLIVVFMDELLAPRALGGLFLLAATPMLQAARFHPSAWRFLVGITAYLLVLAGIVLVLTPFRFRRAVLPLVRNAERCRWAGGAAALVGAAFLAVSLTAL